jgi:hypothetical protein
MVVEHLEGYSLVTDHQTSWLRFLDNFTQLNVNRELAAILLSIGINKETQILRSKA